MSSDSNGRGWLARLAPGVRKVRRRLARRVILQTLRQTLPAEYQTAEFLEGRGMVDQVVARKDLPRVLGAMLATHMMGRDRRTAA